MHIIINVIYINLRSVQLKQHPMIPFNALILVYLLAKIGQCQTTLLYQIPEQGLQFRTASIIISNRLTSGSNTTIIPLQKPFSSTPNIMLSLVSMPSLATVSFFQQSLTRTRTYFVHNIILSQVGLAAISTLKISFCAVNLVSFSYFYPHSIVISLQYVSQNLVPNSEYVRIQYLAPLITANSYQIGAVLAGFEVADLGNASPVGIGVQAELFDDAAYLVKVTAIGGFVKQVQITRFLVDKTAQAVQVPGRYYKFIQTGIVKHYSALASSYFPYQIDFHSQALFYGIMQFQQNFDLTLSLVNIAPSPKANLMIGVIVFMQKLCPSSFPKYQPVTMTCYQNCTIRLYQVDLMTCGLCFGACYSCTGPSRPQCTQYLPIQSNSNLVCLPQFSTHSLTQHCRACTSHIKGCSSCTPSGQCLVCKNSCTLVNSSYCNCSPLCPASNQWHNSITNQCQCSYQYYSNGSICIPCPKGCYICTDSTNCLVCIDRYELLQAYCMLFQHSTYLIDANNGYIPDDSRCVEQIGTVCATYCHASSYMFQFKCFLYQCPPSTFAITEIYSNSNVCQQCQQGCLQCDLYYICKKCTSQEYYLNSTVQKCQKCMAGCKKCQSLTACQQCLSGYSGPSCIQSIPSAPSSCPQGCQICLISQYCQKCLPGYTRLGNNFTCSKCSGMGLTIAYQLVDGIIMEKCQSVCGDGIVVTEQCDDGNQQQGDGCYQCMVQDGFQCVLVGTGSLCWATGLYMECSFSQYLYQNKINITVSINNGVAPSLNYQCPSQMSLISYIKSSRSHTFSFSYSETVEHKTCKFSIPISPNIPSISSLICLIQSSPQSFLLSSPSSASSSSIISLILSYTKQSLSVVSQPLKYLMWVVCILGIDHYSVLINHTLLFLYIGMLYEYWYQLPAVYAIHDQLISIAYGGRDLKSKDEQGFFEGCKIVLILIAGSIGFRELVCRVGKIRVLFADGVVKVFEGLFRCRFVHYLCLFNSFQPMIILFITSIFSHTEQPIPILPFAVASIHLLFFLFSAIIMALQVDTFASNKTHIKYLYLIVMTKFIAVVMIFCIFYQSDKLFVLPHLVAAGLLLWLIYAIADGSKEEGFYNKIEGEDEEQAEDYGGVRYNGWTYAKMKIRNFNIFASFSSFIVICLLRILYWNYYQQTHHQLFAMIITVLFVGVNLYLGFILHIVQIFITLGIFVKGELQNKEEEEDQNQSNRNGRRKNHFETISISQFSRDNINT